MIFSSLAYGSDNNTSTQNRATGILPQLAVLMRLPDEYQLYDPEERETPHSPKVYEHALPFFAQEVVNKGYELPLPFGVSVIGVYNNQAQLVSDLYVALGKGTVPPEGSPLRPFPTVTIDSQSITQSAQLKVDTWLFPFLNLYATVGKIRGDVNLRVNINETEICKPSIGPRPPVCKEFSNSFELPVKAEVDRTSITVGFAGVYSIDKWYTMLNGSYTDSFGDKASDISTINISARAGRRLFLGNGTLLSPFFGINYLDMDTRVQGTTSLENAFADGDALHVRYDIDLENTDKYAGTIGLNAGFSNKTSLVFEWSKSRESDRVVLSGTYRF